MNSTATLFKKIKNRSHDTIYIFKNYFITVFLILTKINYIQTYLNIFWQLLNLMLLKCQSKPLLMGVQFGANSSGNFLFPCACAIWRLCVCVCVCFGDEREEGVFKKVNRLLHCPLIISQSPPLIYE